jgi:DNA-binding SARP family transcriptional activator
MTASCRVSLCGELAVELGGRRLDAALPGRQGRMLFAYLAANRHRSVSRDELAAVLWPDQPPADADAALRTQLSKLRRVLGPDLLEGRAALSLRLPPGARVDFEEAKDALAVAEAALSRNEWRDALAHAEVVRHLTGRGFCSGLDGPWIQQRRAELEELYLRALECTAQAALSLGGRELRLASEAARELVAASPFRESGHRLLMEAHAARGNVAEALQAYEELRRLLRDELGAAPGAAAKDLHERLLKWGAVTSDASTTGAAPPPATPGVTRFIGRERELALLVDVVERAAVGHGGLVLIGGDAGVGKSRLAAEIARRARARGFVTSTGCCYERRGDLPYMPWVEILESALEETPAAELRHAMGDAAPELARLLPQLRTRFPDIPPPLELPPDQQRRHTFNQLRDFMVRHAAGQPRLYVLEDLHWADDSTLLFIEHLAERLTRAPAVIVGTYRDTPDELSIGLAATLAMFARNKLARVIRLRPHPEREVADLLEALAGRPAPDHVVAAIHAETDGNAFFVEEVFRKLVDGGRLLDEDGHFRSDLRLDDLELPQNVRLVVEQRLQHLSDRTRRMLDAAAVIGRRFTFDLLQAVCGIDDDEL